MVRSKKQVSALEVLFRQVRDPLVLILVVAAIISAATGEIVDALIVLAIVIGSVLLTFIQEYSASAAVSKLMARITMNATVLRDNKPTLLPVEDIVPGDVVLLTAGSLIPADGIVLATNGLFVDQAVFTGETFPVEKMPGIVAVNASLSERTNMVLMGTTVQSGTGRALIVHTGRTTEFGQIGARLSMAAPETEFERGIRRFSAMLAWVMLILVFVVIAINVIDEKPAIDSLLFAVALAVGLTPELLPAIITFNLSKGAQYMSAHGVIVRHLSAIENFGSMDILCTDKTGTITQGVVRLDSAAGIDGAPSGSVLTAAFANAFFQTGLANPLDAAILSAARERGWQAPPYEKLYEIPYDFIRKRLSVVVQDSTSLMITKGALDSVLHVCTGYQTERGTPLPLDAEALAAIQQRFTAWSEHGFRVLGVATRPIDQRDSYRRDDETDLTFIGFLLFFDPPKQDASQTLMALAESGVEVKIISGDNRQVAEHVAQAVGMPVKGILTGAQIQQLSETALRVQAERTTLFVEVDPNQKEHIIRALQKTGHVVGYMGDGINDAPALHTADVGISVNSAVDVAKEAAAFVLLEPGLDVLLAGIKEGRRTFANTLKYIHTTVSANFGNMFSMAGASVLLDFLPLLAKQILLNNFLSDLPALAIAGDAVDHELIERPRRWDIKAIQSFMILFGLLSSVFDYLTFGLLLFIFQSSPAQFRTGWFVESLLTELVIALIVRTRRPFYRSRPGRLLLWITILVITLTLLLPYLPLNTLFDFVPLPLPLLAALIGVAALYVAAAEVTKRFYYRRLGR
jgi:Mg2+-importing ATPase